MQPIPDPHAILRDVDDVANAVVALTWPDDARPDRIGVEVEAFPVSVRSGQPTQRVSLESVLTTLVASTAQNGLIETSSPWSTSLPVRNGGRITLEPGGQVEYSSSPACSVADVFAEIDPIWDHIEGLFRDQSIALAPLGIDPWHTIDEVPQQLTADRYLAMDSFFGKGWPAGATMMRNTCSLQVNLDAGNETDRGERWLAANLISPFLTAMFSTSPGEDGVASRRAHTWQAIDRTRTGLPDWRDPKTVDPREDTVARALGGNVIYVMRGRRCLEIAPGWTFAEWVNEGHPEAGAPTVEDLATHLSTLFHEVRARRGTLEIRSVDALPRRWWRVPAVLTAALLYDSEARAQVIGTLDCYSSRLDEIWRRAAGPGLSDPELARSAEKLARLAIDAACRAEGFDRSSVRSTEEFVDRFTLRGLTPGDELRPLLHDPSRALAWAVGEL